MATTDSCPSLGTIVFVHAHPDDEAIFTGGVMSLLSVRGFRVVLVLATQGELGVVPEGRPADVSIAARRVSESERAAAVLGIQRLEHLGYRDSGMAGDPANEAPGAFAATATADAVARLAPMLAQERPMAVVTYDPRGIYGHPDHVKTHEVAVEAAAATGVPTIYEATVDREYLHFVETHVVVEVHGGERPPGLGLAASTLGLPSVAITCTVDVHSVLNVKRAAMAAHASQIPATSSAMTMSREHFAAVYGFEWFVRHGPPGPIDELPLV